MAELTQKDIERYIEVMDAQEVPQHGRYIEYRGVVYGEGDEFPEGLEALMQELLSG